MKIRIYIFSIVIIALGSCTSHTYDDLEEVLPDPPTSVTYQDVSAIFAGSCIGCHNNPPQNGAPMSLVSYDDVKNAVLERDLLDRISREQGEEGFMPLGQARLPQSSIDLIFLWNEGGLLEN